MERIVVALKPMFDQINSRFEQIDNRFDQINGRFEQIDSRFAKMDSEFAELKGTARRTAGEVSKLRGDVTDIRLEMATKHDIGHQESRLMAFMTEIENSRKERTLAETSYRRHEERLVDHEKRLSRLETRP